MLREYVQGTGSLLSAMAPWIEVINANLRKKEFLEWHPQRIPDIVDTVSSSAHLSRYRVMRKTQQRFDLRINSGCG
jgi:hypothetical protein